MILPVARLLLGHISRHHLMEAELHGLRSHAEHGNEEPRLDLSGLFSIIAKTHSLLMESTGLEYAALKVQ